MATLADDERYEEAALGARPAPRARRGPLAIARRRVARRGWSPRPRRRRRHRVCASTTARSVHRCRRRPASRSTAPVPSRPRRRARGRAIVGREASPAGRSVRSRPLPSPSSGGAALARVLGAHAGGSDAAPRPTWRTAPTRLCVMERAVIVEGARTPIGRFLGSFAETPAVQLGELAAAGGDAPGRRRARRRSTRRSSATPGRPGNGPNTGRQVSVRAGVPDRGRRLQREHRVRLGHEGRPARRAADHARRERGRARGRHREHDPGARTCFPTCGSATGSATPRRSTRCTATACSTRSAG